MKWLKKTCDDCPSQWEGELEDGKFIYIRYRGGTLGYGVGKTIDKAVDNYKIEEIIGDKYDGTLSTEKMLNKLGLVELLKGLMKISIVIPSYNQSQYLNSAISSALDQTVKAHEIIIVDDGSTDNSLEIAKSYDGVKVISQVNKGLPSARNTGIMNATGDYLLFLDSDDMLLENAIKRITEVAEKTNADIISPSLKCFGLAQDEIILMENPTIEDFKVANRVGYCSAIKREALLEIGGYSPRMIFGYEDLALWYDLLSRGKKLVTIQEVLWLYRVKEKSMIHDAQAHHVELMAQIAKDFPQIFSKVVEIKTPLPK